MEGVLLFQSHRGPVPIWKKRYYKLTGQRLRSFTTTKTYVGSYIRGQSKKKQDLDVSECHAKAVHPFLVDSGGISKAFCFEITSADFFLLLCASSNVEREQWIQCFRTASGTTPLPPVIMTTEPVHEGGEDNEIEEDEMLQIHIPNSAHLRQVRQQLYCTRHERGLVKHDILLSSPDLKIPRGNVLVAVNRKTVLHRTFFDMQEYLGTRVDFPLTLEFLRAKAKSGSLRLMPMVSRNHTVTKLLRHSALLNIQTHARHHRKWKSWTCVLDGDQLRLERGSHKSKIFHLADCAVKPVHPVLLVKHRRHCFLLLSSNERSGQSVLLQATTAQECLDWMTTLVHAIELSQGALFEQEKRLLSSQSLLLSPCRLLSSTSSNLCRLPTSRRHPLADYSRMRSDFDLEEDESSFSVDLNHLGRRSSSSSSSSIDSMRKLSLTFEEKMRSSQSEFLDPVQNMMYLRHQNRIVEALQYIRNHQHVRLTYWFEIFHWALSPPNNADPSSDQYERLTHERLNARDEIQIQKDVPRTSLWLEHSSDAPKLTQDESQVRLRLLERVLHAYVSTKTVVLKQEPQKGRIREEEEEEKVDLSSPALPLALHSDTTMNIRQKQLEEDLDEEDLDEEEEGEEAGFIYVQGMNGIAYVALEATGEDELQSFALLRGIVEELLPSIFHRPPHEGESHEKECPLSKIGTSFDQVMSNYFPRMAHVFEQVGLPLFILAYKWLPTLFSDVTLMAGNRQLSLPTLLATWDVCFLLGLEGVMVVALALFSSAEASILALAAAASSSSSSKEPLLVENVSAALNAALTALSPNELFDAVCVVMNTCEDSYLSSLRSRHLDRVRSLFSIDRHGHDGQKT